MGHLKMFSFPLSPLSSGVYAKAHSEEQEWCLHTIYTQAEAKFFT